jgi:hypothetical protein
MLHILTFSDFKISVTYSDIEGFSKFWAIYEIKLISQFSFIEENII